MPVLRQIQGETAVESFTGFARISTKNMSETGFLSALFSYLTALKSAVFHFSSISVTVQIPFSTVKRIS